MLFRGCATLRSPRSRIVPSRRCDARRLGRARGGHRRVSGSRYRRTAAAFVMPSSGSGTWSVAWLAWLSTDTTTAELGAAGAFRNFVDDMDAANATTIGLSILKLHGQRANSHHLDMPAASTASRWPQVRLRNIFRVGRGEPRSPHISLRRAHTCVRHVSRLLSSGICSLRNG